MNPAADQPSSQPTPAQPDADRCTVWPLGPRVRIDVRASLARDPTQQQSIDHAWAAMRTKNPRLYDGPMLAVDSIRPEQGHITLRVASYMALAVQARPSLGGAGLDTGTEQFSVTGVLTRIDEHGRECVLLAQRGTTTRIYGGLWELAPSGGVEPPPAAGSLTELDLIHQLRMESQEELGPTLQLAEPRVVALCRDPIAHSLDAVIRATASIEPIENGHGAQSPEHPGGEAWEYSATRWAPIEHLRSWNHARDPMIPPTLALLRFFGWL